MALQKVFKKSYMDHLRQNINVEDYLKDKFPYEEDLCVQLAGIIAPEYDLLEAIMPFAERSKKNDEQTRKENAQKEFEVAKLIYEAYPSLTPIFAQQDDLWVYLSHVTLFPYVQQRWPDIHTDEDPVNYIVAHWFRNQFLFRSTFAGLWWSVYLTFDKTRDNHFELTETLFKNAELRTNSFGALPLIRYREAMLGVLEFLTENPDLFVGGFNARARYIQKLFEIIGGTKNLVTLPKEFFKKELEKRKSVLLDIHSADEVKGQLDIQL